MFVCYFALRLFLLIYLKVFPLSVIAVSRPLFAEWSTVFPLFRDFLFTVAGRGGRVEFENKLNGIICGAFVSKMLMRSVVGFAPTPVSSHKGDFHSTELVDMVTLQKIKPGQPNKHLAMSSKRGSKFQFAGSTKSII